ncbi:acyl-homoserine-lactone synthase [Bradyrhizobium sp. HKCCYLRH3097]|uniref:acyl-homoserine-lactone synthase n=2 Tax=Bradyrhizobium TaxID=374 RepID=UPI003EBBB1DF
MMIFAFYEDSKLATPSLMDEIYDLRYRIFVEALAWSSLVKPDRRDRDQFDGDDALHVVDIHDGRVMAYSRLLPTTRPHLLSHVYPELVRGRSYPKAPDIFEWTRLCARSEIGDGDVLASRRLMVAIAEICQYLGITGLIAQSKPGWVRRLNRLGWNAQPLADPVVFDGRPTLALEARVSDRTVSTSRKCLGIDTDILDQPSLRDLAASKAKRHICAGALRRTGVLHAQREIVPEPLDLCSLQVDGANRTYSAAMPVT